MFRPIRSTAIAVLLSTLLLSHSASTQDLASAQFESAQKLYDAGDYASALAIFQKALEASGSPNARLYVARCLHKLGRLTEAYEEMDATVQEATARAKDDKKYEQTRDSAAAEKAIIEQRIGRLVIALANAPPNTKVTLDSKPIDLARIGKPIAVLPGTRTVSAVAPDGTTATQQATLAEGDLKTVPLAFGSKDGSTTPPGSSTGPDTTTQTTGGGIRIAGIAVAGLGVAGLVLWGVTGSMANSKFKTLETECNGVRCTDPKYADVVDSGKSLDTLATIGLIGGAAGLAIGGTMIVLGGPKQAPSQSATLTLSPRSATLRVSF